ncbi:MULTISPECIES: tripartite tricarboxylate transporter substrate binding protein [unclassified Caballeronia]|uniref:Bug family tripartite tricarboxylate transporter substrate binding protein n=1 Tax=unclassified Caballeronia TaxID=2646786 RepID=UPI002855F9B0|nr:MULTISPECIES: tripartite tricarboxylate transporter substrate binding protein [unclassified Caballeronia]MDR5815431.1 tripartite tricarboxylate transporter substrate binding protein [Caballeronia sp. LZ033]MDR5822003.1 tripartite tricarboxylate transporter substrate binding protein [Caballeronia sp. LZ043]MDR5880159.1 tripartite tricarboxylate transporter substrate binding protein [Caballeronia sp. LZ032]
MKLTRLLGAIGLACCAILPVTSHADDSYPTQTIRLVVGFPPGGGGDLYGRALAAALAPILHQTVIVDNRPGAGGIIAAETVAHAKPDGYTLLLAMSGNLATAPAIRKRLPYKVPESFAPIALVAEAPQGLMVSAKSKYHTLADFISAAKGGKLSYASTGTGSAAQLGMEMFKQAAGVDVLHVPYKGSGPAINDLISGRVDAFFATYPPLAGQIKGGQLRLLASTAEKRNAQMPDVPTMKEAGVNMTLTQWYGLAAPAGTPAPVVAKLEQATMQALAAPTVKELFDREGVVPGTLTGDAFSKYIVEDIGRYRQTVQKGHMQLLQ